MAKLPGRIPASQVTSFKGWLPPEIDGTGNGNGKTIRLMSQLKPGKMDLRREASRAVDAGVSESPQKQTTPPTTSPTAPAATAATTPVATPVATPGKSSSEAPVSENLVQEDFPAEALLEAADIPSETDGYAEGFKKGETEGFVKGEKSGHDSGFDVGSKAGKQQAESEFSAEVAGQRNAIESLQKAFLQPPDYDKNLQQGLVDLVTELTKVVVSHEIKTRPEFIQSLVEQALSALPHGTEIPRIFANPADIEFLQSMSSHDVELVADSGMARGGCRVVAGQSQIEAGLSLRIRDALTAACRGEVVPAIKDIDMQELESVIEVDPNHHAEE